MKLSLLLISLLYIIFYLNNISSWNNDINEFISEWQNEKIKNLFFIHIPKTGGTSIDRDIKSYHTKDNRAPCCQKAKVKKTLWQSCLNNNIQHVYSYEMRISDIIEYYPCASTTLFFLILREPHSWILSAFHHMCKFHPNAKILTIPCADNDPDEALDLEIGYFENGTMPIDYFNPEFYNNYNYIAFNFDHFELVYHFLNDLFQHEKKEIEPRNVNSYNHSEILSKKMIDSKVYKTTSQIYDIVRNKEYYTNKVNYKSN